MNGILVVDKPEGFTSFDVVAKLRGICGTRKIGHGGTLDPMATGVLPVFVGPAVKAVDLQPRQDKIYEAEFLFGLATDTGDITGASLREAACDVDAAVLKACLPAFLGAREQLPPMYSAVKLHGKPLYKYAREGQTVERKPRPITIHAIELLERTGLNRFSLRVHCSKGTYIRVLAEEVGEALGLPATLSGLRRTGAGVFTAEEASTLAQLQQAKDEGTLEDCFTPLERVFEDWPLHRVDDAETTRLFNGAKVKAAIASGRYRLCGPGGFLGIGQAQGGLLRAEKLFIERERA